MHSEGFFYQAFIYLGAAVIAVPIAKRLGLGSVLGYLLAGVAIGPFGLRLIGQEGHDVMHFAEFGVVMMLFLVGLELQPRLLWHLRAPIIGLGGLQVAATSIVIGAIALPFVPWRSALAIGMILSLSSTAIVLQSLNEKGLAKTSGGQSSFSVLLFQDIAVIPMLAILPLLAFSTHPSDNPNPTWVDGLPAWGHTLVVLGAVGSIIAAGTFIMRPAFRFIARTKLREVFVAASLLLVIGIALLMTKVGLSPALGTFVAGVVLANNEYRHELESDVEPFKGLLLGLFFLAVGASIDFGLVTDHPALILGLVAALIATKFLILAALGRVFRLALDQNLLFALALAQGGEFAFVLFSFTTQHEILPSTVSGPLIAVVALSMAVSPLVMLLNDKLIQPRFGTKRDDPRPSDLIDHARPVLIAGFGRFGSIVGRLLQANGIQTTVLDNDSDHVDVLRKLGMRVYYGDASRADLLHAAGAHQAQLIIIAIDDPDKVNELVHTVQRHYPKLTIFARAKSTSRLPASRRRRGSRLPRDPRLIHPPRHRCTRDDRIRGLPGRAHRPRLPATRRALPP